MALFKKIIFITFTLSVLVSFSQCSSTKKLQNSTPFEIGKVYYQNWFSGVEGGGSGTNLYIPIIANSNNIMLDSAYFRGDQVKLEFKNDTLFIGHFKKSINKKPDIIMSSEPFAEYRNQVPKLQNRIPFELKEDECVISYNFKNKTRYFKINKVIEKEPKHYR